MGQDKKKLIIVVGCGRLGSMAAGSLYEQGMEVSVIDENEDSFKRLPSAFGGLTVTGYATHLDILKKAETPRADAVICATNHDNVNIMTALLVRDLYRIPEVFARIYDPEIAGIYEGMGIHTICPATLATSEIRHLLGSLKSGTEGSHEN
jgi:trk system potassium uptake protein TrkA